MKLAIAVLIVSGLGMAPGFAKYDGPPPPSPPPPAVVHHAKPTAHPVKPHVNLLAKLFHHGKNAA